MHDRRARTERQNHLSAKLEARTSTGPKARGLFATTTIERGELLVVWGGDEVDQPAFDLLPDDLRVHSLQIGDGLYLVPLAEHPVDWVNHSCEPNAGLLGDASLVALRAIDEGEEIAFDYATSDASSYDEFDCLCGSTLCRGKVTGEDWMRPELQERYDGRFSPYLRQRIAKLRTDRER